jgi:hypothetical protein
VSPGASYGFKADARSKKKINEAIMALRGTDPVFVAEVEAAERTRTERAVILEMPSPHWHEGRPLRQKRVFRAGRDRQCPLSGGRPEATQTGCDFAFWTQSGNGAALLV